MATPLVLAWVGLASIVGLNGFAAGVAAVLYAWRSGLRRGGRTFLASVLAGFLSASSFIGLGLLGSPELATEEPWILVGVFGGLFAVATVISGPGALLVARKLEKPGDDFRAFE